MFDVWSSRAHCSGMPCAETALGPAGGCRGASEYEQNNNNNNSKQEKLTVNSPVTASKPTCMVCSKSEGGEISGRSLSRSFFLPPKKKKKKGCWCYERINSSYTGQHWATVNHRYQKGLETCCPLTFFGSRKDWDDFVPRFSFLGHRRQRFGAVVGREGVFAGTGAEDGAAHADRRGGGFILRVAVIAHLWRLFGRGERRAHWAKMDRGKAQSQTDRVADRGCETALTSAWGTDVIMQRPEVAPDDQSWGRVAPSAPGAISDVQTKKSIKAFLPNGACMWCKVIWKWHFKFTDYWGRQCIQEGLFELMHPYISGLAFIIYSIILRSESKMHKTSNEMEIKRLLCC